MACLRCRSKTEERQAFCDQCLEEMEKYPVKPGTAIHLPRRETVRVEKKAPARHREATAAEQVDRLHKVIRWMLCVIALLSVLLLLTAGMVLHLLEKETPTGMIGRNYTTAVQETQP